MDRGDAPRRRGEASGWVVFLAILALVGCAQGSQMHRFDRSEFCVVCLGRRESIGFDRDRTPGEPWVAPEGVRCESRAGELVAEGLVREEHVHIWMVVNEWKDSGGGWDSCCSRAPFARVLDNEVAANLKRSRDVRDQVGTLLRNGTLGRDDFEAALALDPRDSESSEAARLTYQGVLAVLRGTRGWRESDGPR